MTQYDMFLFSNYNFKNVESIPHVLHRMEHPKEKTNVYSSKQNFPLKQICNPNNSKSLGLALRSRNAFKKKWNVSMAAPYPFFGLIFGLQYQRSCNW